MKKLLVFAVLILAGISLHAQTELVIPTGHEGFLGINGLATSPDGVLAASFVDEEVKIWDIKKHMLLKTVREKGYMFGGAAFSPDSKTLTLIYNHNYTSSTKTVNIVTFDTRSLKEKTRLETGVLADIRCLAYSPDGKYIYLGGTGDNATIARMDVGTGQITAMYKNLSDYAYKISVSPDGTKLVAEIGVGPEHDIILNTADGTVIREFKTSDGRFAFTPKGNLLNSVFLYSRDAGKLNMRFKFNWLDPVTFAVQATQTVKYTGDLVTNTPEYTFGFFPDSDDFLFNPDRYYHIVSRSGPIKNIPYATKIEENYRLHVSVVNAGLAVVVRENYISLLNLLTAEHQQFGVGVIKPDMLYSAADGKTLGVMGQYAAKPYFITWANGKLIVNRMQSAFSQIGASVNTSVNGKMVSWAEAASVKVADVADINKPVSSFPIKNGEYTVISADNNLIAVAAGNVPYPVGSLVYIANRKTGSVKSFGKGYFTEGAFSDDNRYFLGIWNKLNEEPAIALFDLQRGTKLWEVNYKLQNHLFAPFFYNRDEVGFLDEQYQEFHYLQLSNGTDTRSEKLTENALAGSPALQRSIIPAFLNKPSLLAGFHMDAVVDSGRYHISSYADNTLKVYNRNNVELMDIILMRDDNDWAVITPDGRFDASESMMKKLYYANGRQIIALEKLFEKYYTPNLGGRLLAGEVLPPVPPVSGINTLPRVKISYAEITRNLDVVDDKIPVYQNTSGVASITINASAENDKIDEIRLFQNGKIVNLATRGLFVSNNTTGTDSKTYTINLLPGANNFRALALNSQRTESEPSDIVVNYRSGGAQPNTPAVNTNLNNVIAPVDRDATLHLVVVGINQYQNPKMSLNYALADASAFKDEAEKDAKTITQNVKTYFVTDAKADKSGIVDALKAVQQNAKPQDVLVFYYAGHGVISEKNREFYLVPTNVTDLKNVDEALAQNGIPSKMLQQYAIDIAAQKQVFILDACQSAGAFATLLSKDGDQQKNLAVVARSTGTHWIAASGSQQFANEFSQLGHGAFTYVLLKAMKGEAVSNRMITVNGLKNYLQVQVPDLMKKYNGTPQYPASYGFGNDFPVEVVK